MAIIALCRQFMANIHTADDTPGKEKLESWVRKTSVVLTLNTFVQIYGVPRVENAPFAWPGLGLEATETICNKVLKPGALRPGDTQTKKKFLNERYLPLFIWSCHTLLPLSWLAEISLMRAQLLWAIETG